MAKMSIYAFLKLKKEFWIIILSLNECCIKASYFHFSIIILCWYFKTCVLPLMVTYIYFYIYIIVFNSNYWQHLHDLSYQSINQQLTYLLAQLQFKSPRVALSTLICVSYTINSEKFVLLHKYLFYLYFESVSLQRYDSSLEIWIMLLLYFYSRKT